VIYFLGCAYVLSGPIEKYVLAPPVEAYQKVKKRRRVKQSLERLEGLQPKEIEPTPLKNEENVTPIRRS